MHKIGVISDTHNVLREPVTAALRHCDVILHGGDIHTEQLLTQLETIAPVYAVRGNADIHTNMKLFVKTDRHGSTPAAAAGVVFCSLQQWQY